MNLNVDAEELIARYYSGHRNTIGDLCPNNRLGLILKQILEEFINAYKVRETLGEVPENVYDIGGFIKKVETSYPCVMGMGIRQAQILIVREYLRALREIVEHFITTPKEVSVNVDPNMIRKHCEKDSFAGKSVSQLVEEYRAHESKAVRTVKLLPPKQLKFEGFDGVEGQQGASKHDQPKVRVDLLPVTSLEEISKVLAFGAAKYGDYNWAKGMKWSRLYAAALRHLFAWFAGQDKDEESGLRHLAHAGCCILFLLHYDVYSIGEDDRPGIYT